jgi:hypothetical protein
MSGRSSEPVAKRGDPCVVCGGERKRPKTGRHAWQAERDPFCSTDCARSWHGVDRAPEHNAEDEAMSGAAG